MLDDDDERLDDEGHSGIDFVRGIRDEAAAIARIYIKALPSKREKIRRVMLLRFVAKAMEDDYRGDFSHGAMRFKKKDPTEPGVGPAEGATPTSSDPPPALPAPGDFGDTT